MGVVLIVAWSIPLIALLTTALGVGTAWLRLRRSGPGRSRRLIVQITTRGKGPEANDVIAALEELPGRLPREVWVVVDEGAAARFPEADRVVTVPVEFECRARAKGRALEWARLVREREGITGDEVKVLLLDDDSAPSASYLRRCEDVDADISQGIVAPRRHYGRLLSHLDDLRPLHCLAVCSWAQARGNPIHVHGEGLCLRASAEHAVGWDAEGSDLAEDLVFGQRASGLSLRWAFLPAVIENTSPWTAHAFITQRKRWTWGTVRAFRHIPVRARIRIAALYVITLGGFAVSTVGTVLTLVHGDSPVGPWTPSLLAWLGLFALAGWISSKGNVLQATVAMLLAWLTSVANALIVPLVLLLGPPDGFRTIAKLRPRRRARPASRAAGFARVVVAVLPGVVGLGLLTTAASSSDSGGSGEARWTGDDAGGLVVRKPDIDRRAAADIRARRLSRAERPDLSHAISVIAYGNDPYFGHKADHLLGRLQRLGLTHISLTIPVFTTGPYASEVHADPELTPDKRRIEAFAALAHGHGMTVGLNPLLDEDVLAASGGWRGSLAPADREAWFASYARLALHFAGIANAGHFQSYNVGTEFETLAEDPGWRKVLAAVRGRFDGTVSYAMAGSRVSDIDVPWIVSHVDEVGVNAWYEADLPPGASESQIAAAYEPWRLAIRRFAAKVKAPIVFTEAGAPSQVGSYQQPTLVRPGIGPDASAQASTYEAICFLSRRVDAKGVIWWATTLDPPKHPDEDTSFDPLGKPAERTVGKC